MPYKDPEKQRERLRKWRAANPDKVRAQQKRSNRQKQQSDYYDKNNEVIFENYIKRTYNIDLNKYNSLLSEQQGVCAICKKECVSGRRLAIDHNHDTGEVRGLLCCKCNRGLGNLNDDLELLRQAVLYLERYSINS